MKYDFIFLNLLYVTLHFTVLVPYLDFSKLYVLQKESIYGLILNMGAYNWW